MVDYVAKCLTCQRVKIEHQLPTGLLQLLDDPKCKWYSVSMDFVVGLPLTQRKNNEIRVVVRFESTQTQEGVNCVLPSIAKFSQTAGMPIWTGCS